jgi:hypothetical protein
VSDPSLLVVIIGGCLIPFIAVLFVRYFPGREAGLQGGGAMSGSGSGPGQERRISRAGRLGGLVLLIVGLLGVGYGGWLFVAEPNKGEWLGGLDRLVGVLAAGVSLPPLLAGVLAVRRPTRRCWRTHAGLPARRGPADRRRSAHGARAQLAAQRARPSLWRGHGRRGLVVGGSSLAPGRLVSPHPCEPERVHGAEQEAAARPV